jgi:hypothetical protein
LVNMPKKLTTEVDQEVRRLSGEGLSNRDIVKALKGTENAVSRGTVPSTLSFVGYRRNHGSIVLKSPTVYHGLHTRPARTKRVIQKIDLLTRKETQPRQIKIGKRPKVSEGTVPKVIQENLKKKVNRKHLSMH